MSESEDPLPKGFTVVSALFRTFFTFRNILTFLPLSARNPPP